MIISRTPFRISFTGGGTDIKTFFKNEPGLVINATINKYVYITVNKKFDEKLRVSYSKTENIDDSNQVKHPIIRTTLKRMKIKNGIEITSMADIPGKGSGLGSSSSFTVGLLNALHAYKGKHSSARQLAEEACYIERGLLREPGGKQDQFASSYGGINLMEFKPNGDVLINPVIFSNTAKKRLEKNLLMFYTGITRNGTKIIRKQFNRTKRTLTVLRKMKELTKELNDSLINNRISEVGPILHRNWILKSGLSSSISNRAINSIYEKAMGSGATGGKLMGAGGGGFLLFYVPVSRQRSVRKALKGIKEIDFSFEPQGSKIIYISD